MVVIAHGLTANKDDPRLVPLASELHRLGFDVISYDSRGHGQSGGRCTLGALERHDVTAVVDWVRGRCDRIILVGASMGALSVLGHAAADPELLGVVTVSSPSGWRLPLRARSVLTAWLARTQAGRALAHRKMGVRIGPWMSPESARTLVKRVDCPVIVVHGRKDPIIPVRSGLANVVARDPERSVVLVPSMGHAFDPVGYSSICEAVTTLAERPRGRTTSSAVWPSGSGSDRTVRAHQNDESAVRPRSG